MRGSWQFGQVDVCGWRSASCARRLRVRALEWRRFGLGIITPIKKMMNFAGRMMNEKTTAFYSSFIIPHYCFQPRPARVNFFGLAAAGVRVSVRAAGRAQALALRCAEGARRQRQE